MCQDNLVPKHSLGTGLVQCTDCPNRRPFPPPFCQCIQLQCCPTVLNFVHINSVVLCLHNSPKPNSAGVSYLRPVYASLYCITDTIHLQLPDIPVSPLIAWMLKLWKPWARLSKFKVILLLPYILVLLFSPTTV